MKIPRHLSSPTHRAAVLVAVREVVRHGELPPDDQSDPGVPRPTPILPTAVWYRGGGSYPTSLGVMPTAVSMPTPANRNLRVCYVQKLYHTFFTLIKKKSSLT